MVGIIVAFVVIALLFFVFGMFFGTFSRGSEKPKVRRELPGALGIAASLVAAFEFFTWLLNLAFG